MNRSRAIIVMAASSAAVAASQDDAARFTSEERRLIAQHVAQPMPSDPTNRFTDDPAAAHLGQYLFYDTRFSSNGEVSCATCHDPAKGFSDGKQVGEGVGTLTRHSQSLWNAAANHWFFWDGRADSLWAQALQPMEHPLEADGSRLAIAHAVHDDPALRQAYERIFGSMPGLDDAARFPAAGRPALSADDESHEPLHRAWASMASEDQAAVNRLFVNLAKAIAAYERRLVSTDSPFDRFARDLQQGVPSSQLSLTAQRGLKLFIGRANCRLCHAGANFTDGEFHLTGVPPLGGGPLHDAGRYDGARLVQNDPFNAPGPFSDDPDGRASRRVRFLRRSPEQWGQFKTPGLRHVAESPPYMHQGQFESLEAVVRFYSTLEGARSGGHHREAFFQPLNLSEEEVADLVAFLESLTGARLPEHLLRQPVSPIPTDW